MAVRYINEGTLFEALCYIAPYLLVFSRPAFSGTGLIHVSFHLTIIPLVKYLIFYRGCMDFKMK